MQIGVFIRVLYVDRPSSVSHSLTKHHTLCIALFTDRDAGMSSPATTASSIPTTPTTPCSLPSPITDTAPMSFLALPPPAPAAIRPRRIPLEASFKLQAPPASRSTIIEEQDEDVIQIIVPPRPIAESIAIATRPAPGSVVSPSATRPNKSFADAVAGRNPAPGPTASSATMALKGLSGQPRSTQAGARTHRRAQSISVSVSYPSARRLAISQDQGPVRRPASLTPSPRMVHFAPIAETGADVSAKSADVTHRARPAHPRVSALAPPHPGLRPSYGLAPPSRFQSREDSVPRITSAISLPSFEDDAFAIRGSSSYAFGTNPVAIAVGRAFEQWGH
ncbi:hypothetical protein CTheo_251 [Ceratobasidium theobromae]|uniref:Uncharacterized protein n=1 Tax=Ceratobasidium theobromae TaxID=1582974 RepID=A0A5N5QZH3_9AGAM|nr:hypothetical protein CTheo_251 [Ceratobasidium theobromae]